MAQPGLQVLELGETTTFTTKKNLNVEITSTEPPTHTAKVLFDTYKDPSFDYLLTLELEKVQYFLQIKRDYQTEAPQLG